MSNQTPEQSRLELMAGHVLGDLDEAEATQLALYTDPNDKADVLQLEQTAAAVFMAFVESKNNELPLRLREKVVRDALDYFGDAESQDERIVPPTGSESVGPSQQENREFAATPASPSRSWSMAVSWLTTAAAVFIAFGLWWSGRKTDPIVLSAADQRQALIETAVDLTRVEWVNGPTPFGETVTGDVIWSNEQQTGFMRFVGMPTNDKAVEQYQLWIIDPQRDDEPIDGGVFDITSTGEMIVPIDAKLRVLEPNTFAITIEKPGGVVVSTQERLPLVASVK